MGIGPYLNFDLLSSKWAKAVTGRGSPSSRWTGHRARIWRAGPIGSYSAGIWCCSAKTVSSTREWMSSLR